MKNVIVVMILCLSPMTVWGKGPGDVVTQLPFTSWHPQGDHFNENNKGFGLEVHQDGYYFMGGTYHNSIYQQTNYLGVGRKVELLPWTHVGIEGGLISGYMDDVILGAVPYVAVGPEQVQLKAYTAPTIAYGFTLNIQIAQF